MPREFPRTRRVGEQIQRELADLIRNELKDPRFGMASISAVTVSRDLGHAKVYISVLGSEEQAAETMDVLKRAAGFLRHKLGKMLHMRTIPELHFFQDHSLEQGAHISALINRALASDKRNKDQ